MSKSSQTIILIIIGIATLAVSLVVSTFLFVLGLILADFILYPMALCISALFTAVTAVALNNLLFHDERHTALRPVVIVCEATAVILAAVLIIITAVGAINVPVILPSGAAALILALTAIIAARHYRAAEPAASNEKLQAVTWIALALAAIPLIIFIASIFGLAGA